MYNRLLNLKNSFKSTDHIQKKEHWPYFNYQFKAVCIKTKETKNLSLNEYFVLSYSVSLPKQYLSKNMLKKKN